MSNNGPQKKTWANIFLVIGSTCLAFLLAEIVLRILNPSPHGFDDKKIFINANLSGPGYCYPTNPRRYFPIDLNTTLGFNKLTQLGVSEAEAKHLSAVAPYCVVANEKLRRAGDFPGRQHTVAIIGDSFAFGEGLKDEHTLAHLMGLKTATANFCNFGRSGATIAVVIEEMADVIASCPEAQKVIYFYNLNDMYETQSLRSMEAEINDLQNVRWYRRDSDSLWDSLIQKSKFLLFLRQSRIVREQSLKTIQWYNALYESEENRRSREEAFSDVLKIKKQSENVGKSFTLVVYPLLYKSMGGEYPFAGVHAIIMNFCERSGLHCLDASHAFDDERTATQFTVHPLDFHPNELANQKVVDYLFTADPELFR